MTQMKSVLRLSVLTMVLGVGLGGAALTVTGEGRALSRATPPPPEARQIADMKPFGFCAQCAQKRGVGLRAGSRAARSVCFPPGRRSPAGGAARKEDTDSCFDASPAVSGA